MGRHSLRGDCEFQFVQCDRSTWAGVRYAVTVQFSSLDSTNGSEHLHTAMPIRFRRRMRKGHTPFGIRASGFDYWDSGVGQPAIAATWF